MYRNHLTGPRSTSDRHRLRLLSHKRQDTAQVRVHPHNSDYWTYDKLQSLTVQVWVILKQVNDIRLRYASTPVWARSGQSRNLAFFVMVSLTLSNYADTMGQPWSHTTLGPAVPLKTKQKTHPDSGLSSAPQSKALQRQPQRKPDPIIWSTKKYNKRSLKSETLHTKNKVVLETQSSLNKQLTNHKFIYLLSTILFKNNRWLFYDDKNCSLTVSWVCVSFIYLFNTYYQRFMSRIMVRLLVVDVIAFRACVSI